jgi:hypothetical protein
LQEVGLAESLVAAVLGAVSAGIAVWAVLMGLATLRNSYRPILRPVPVKHLDANQEPTGNVSLRRLILKNYGTGPALSVRVIEKEDRAGKIMAQLDVVEPLGEPLDSGESTRIGRGVIAFEADIDEKKWYRILYQDVSGRWHETRFTFDKRDRFEIAYFGARPWWHFRKIKIPHTVTGTAQVIISPEAE